MALTLIPPTALLASVLILALSHGLMVVLLPVRLGDTGVETDTIGLVLSLYAMGMLLGGLYNNALLKRVGHVRAFASAAALVSVSILACALSANPVLWGAMRLLNGFAMAIALAVIDNWLSEIANRETRGRLLGANQMVITAGMLIGQFMFNLAEPSAATLFIIGGMMASLALVPLGLSRQIGPTVEENVVMSLGDAFKRSPSAVVGCLFSGLLIWVFFGMLPLYGSALQLSGFELTLLSGSAILGSVVFQFPIGWLSDHFDRRSVLALVMTLALSICALIPIIASESLWLLLLMVSTASGLCSSLYATSISQAFDNVRQGEMAAIVGPLIMAYAIGAIVSPLLSSYAMIRFGADALFYLMAFLQALFLIFLLVRMRRRESLPVEEQESYVVQAPLAIATINELDPRMAYNEMLQSLSPDANYVVQWAESHPQWALEKAVEVVAEDSDQLIRLSYALASVNGIDSRDLMRCMTRLAPEQKADIAQAIAMAYPEGASDIVDWLMAVGDDDAVEVVASMAQAVPEASADIVSAALEPFDDSQTEEVAQEFIESYSGAVSEQVENMRPVDREAENWEEQVAEVFTAVAEAAPEVSAELVQTVTEAVPEAALEVSEAYVQQVVSTDDKASDVEYNEEAAEAISEHLSHLVETVPEIAEEVAANIIESVPEAAEDVDEALRNLQDESHSTQSSEEKDASS